MGKKLWWRERLRGKRNKVKNGTMGEWSVERYIARGVKKNGKLMTERETEREKRGTRMWKKICRVRVCQRMVNAREGENRTKE